MIRTIHGELPDDEVIEVVLHPALRRDLVEWMEQRGLDLCEGSSSGDRLRWFVASPKWMPRG